MDVRAVGVTVGVGAALVWLLGGIQREKPVLSAAEPGALRQLEAEAAAHPGDPAASGALAQAYLDARQPGLVVALVASAEPAVRDDVRVRHVLARALVDQGRNERALAVESEVVARCRPLAEGGAAPTGCDGLLLASAVRRTGILGALVSAGVEDSVAHPEASLIAYANATREARVVVE